MSPDFRSDRVIVKLKPGANSNEISNLQAQIGVTKVSKASQLGIDIWQIPDGNVEKIISTYKNDPRFEYIEPDYIITLEDTSKTRNPEESLSIITPQATTPNDPDYSQLWGLNNTGQSGGTADADIDAPEAWDIQKGNQNLVIGVIDTGVDYNHPDLSANIWTNPGEIAGDGIDNDSNGYIDDVRGWDFAYNDNNPMDVHGHGTHVAGTIAGKGNNGVGVTGVAWNAKIMPLKFLNDSGSGSTSNAILAINYATAKGVKLTNNSWGGGGYSQALYDAINTAGQQGALFIAAAGNSSQNTDTTPAYPASYDLANIISVASTTRTDGLSWFSNYGATTVDLGAPGSDIYSAWPNSTYNTISGTSMASPHVTGAAALLWSQNPTWTAQQVKNSLMSTGDSISALNGKTVSGKRLNIYNALAPADTTPPTASSFTPADNATGVAVGANLVVNFSEAIQKGSGNIVIKKVSDNSVVETIAVTNSNVTVSGSQLTINPTNDLAQGTDYYVEIANGAIKDIAGNNYAGITGNSTWNFQTVAPTDTTPPTVSSFSPADNATGVAVGANLVVNFSEAIQKGSGNIVIKKVSDNSVVETIAVTNSNVTVSGSQLTINPTNDLAQGTDYYVEIANGAIKDIAGNNYAGITGNSTWNFTTTSQSSGSFTEDTSISLPGVYYSSVAWADYSGDGKQDFLLTGYSNSGRISKLYKNTGSGFSEDTTISLPGVDGSVAWADYNGDGKQDFLLTGYSSSGGRISKLYKNTGSGFSEDTTVSLPGVGYSSVAWADYSGDGKQDFLLTGSTGSGYISKLYKNTGSGFSEDTSVSLPGVYYSSVAWADYNGDGKQDFLLTGWSSSGSYISKLYKNTGSGFSEDTTVSLPGVGGSSVAWADYSGDGKQDFLLTGYSSSGRISKLYKNTGSGFSEDTSVSLPGVSYSSVAWADYSGDGKQDFLLTGYSSSGYISKLYKNTGSGFSEDTSVSLPGVGGSSVAWADYSGDGKQDFLLTGYTNSNSYISKLYKNTATPSDTTPPTASSFTPADNATGVAVAANLVVNFSEAIQKGSGNIVIKKVSDNSVVETIAVTNSNVTVSGSQLTINPTNDLAQGTDYYVEIANAAIKDIAGNNYAGITGNSTWNFQTVAPTDTTPPTANSFTPADNATGVAVAANLVVNFSEAIQKGSGNIVIKKVSDNSVVETIAVTNSNVTVSGSQLTINPTNDLAQG
ncbi:Ig-like domain-containing protein, partial [Planktothricoides raciborskii]